MIIDGHEGKKPLVDEETRDLGRFWFLRQVERDQVLDEDTPKKEFFDYLPGK